MGRGDGDQSGAVLAGQRYSPLYGRHPVRRVPETRSWAEDGVFHHQHLLGGKLHRTTGPAMSEVGEDGSGAVHYYVNGVRHRDSGPAMTVTGSDGSRREFYWAHGQLQRVIQAGADGYVFETYYKPGATVRRKPGVPVTWAVEGEFHRENLPATVARRTDGTKVECYLFDGQLHREDGPAVVETDADGNVLYEEFHVHGQVRARPS